ncbi:MAG TPA: carboxypeptidase-like regulatory domain-containing protein [Thermoanaerobaculia bacterium]|jgi:hypothetical protein
MLKRAAFLGLLVAMYSASLFTTNGCAGLNPTEVETVLVGFVKDDASGAPVAGAQASIQGVSALSNAQGTFRIGGLSPEEGRLVVEHRSYLPYEASVRLSQGESVIDVKLRPR